MHKREQKYVDPKQGKSEGYTQLKAIVPTRALRRRPRHNIPTYHPSPSIVGPDAFGLMRARPRTAIRTLIVREIGGVRGLVGVMGVHTRDGDPRSKIISASSAEVSEFRPSICGQVGWCLPEMHHTMQPPLVLRTPSRDFLAGITSSITCGTLHEPTIIDCGWCILH
jgi:hypothetical protein